MGLPEVMALEPVGPHAYGHLEKPREVLKITFHVRCLKRHRWICVAVSYLISYHDELLDVRQVLFMVNSDHDIFSNVFCGPVYRNLHITGKGKNLLTPTLWSKSWKCTISREIDLEFEFPCQVQNFVEVLIQKGLTHGAWDYLLQPVAMGAFDYPLNHFNGHEPGLPPRG